MRIVSSLLSCFLAIEYVHKLAFRENTEDQHVTESLNQTVTVALKILCSV